MDRVCSLIFSGSKVSVTFDSGRAYTLRKTDMLEFPLHENDEVDEEEFRQFVLLRQYPSALNAAVEMLARRACSRKEIESRLVSRGFCEEVCSLVVYKLEKEKLLDDRDFSEQWVRYRSGGHYGPNRIYQELRMKGVDENTARNALSEMDREDQMRNAFDLAEKHARKTKPGEDLYKARRRVLRVLVTHGYDWDTAREACDMAFDPE